ncbi:RNA polymerase sigma factor [Planctomicrobium sp. SH661]|uniref:RNA polymerase sigma factor n=1 Tax=Planctomicrobium sp. SH661 TaxID=3448124 RepID=UPI003F5B4359
MSDDELMIRLQAGEDQVFSQIVDRYQAMLIGFFMRNTRDLQLSEDLAQETLLKVYNQAWDYLPLGRFRGWMFRIGRNLLIDDVRRRSNDALVRTISQNSAEEQDAMNRMAGEVVPPEQKMEQSEFTQMIDDILAEIPEDQRQTFTLHYYSDLSLQEVAEITEVSPATAKSRLRLAKEKLAEKLRSRGMEPRSVYDSSHERINSGSN